MRPQFAVWLQDREGSPAKRWLRTELGAVRHRGQAWACRRPRDLGLPNRVWRGLYLGSSNYWKFTDRIAVRMMLLGAAFRVLDTLGLLRPVRSNPIDPQKPSSSG